MSLSEIKFEHIDGVIRRELVSGECAPQPERPAVPAHPYWGQLKVCYFLYAKDRLKVGGVMRHDVAGSASIGPDQCGLVRMFRS